ncbi:unnamed protein product, partial [Allacma fusca]
MIRHVLRKPGLVNGCMEILRTHCRIAWNDEAVRKT